MFVNYALTRNGRLQVKARISLFPGYNVLSSTIAASNLE